MNLCKNHGAMSANMSRFRGIRTYQPSSNTPKPWGGFPRTFWSSQFLHNPAASEIRRTSWGGIVDSHVKMTGFGIPSQTGFLDDFRIISQKHTTCLMFNVHTNEYSLLLVSLLTFFTRKVPRSYLYSKVQRWIWGVSQCLQSPTSWGGNCHHGC